MESIINVLQKNLINLYILYFIEKHPIDSTSLYKLVKNKLNQCFSLNEGMLFSHIYQLEANMYLSNEWIATNDDTLPTKRYNITKEGLFFLNKEKNNLLLIINLLNELANL